MDYEVTRQRLKEVLSDTCTPVSDAADRMGIPRIYVVFVLNGKIQNFTKYYNVIESYIEEMSKEWKFSPTILLKAIKESGMRQKEVAYQIGIDPPSLCRIISGKNKPRRDKYLKIREFCIM